MTRPAFGLYDPRFERDACGVGLVARIDGAARRDVVVLGLQGLKSVWHRGAVDADGKTGDGAGLLIDIPAAFFAEQVARTGHVMRGDDICVGMAFLPRTDLAAQERARTIVEAELLRAGAYIYGWRQVPVDIAAIGAKANAVRPEIEQIMFHLERPGDPDERERALYLVRRRMEKRIASEGVPAFYICSLSARTLIYKGMFLAEQIDRFYPDLRDERFVSRIAIFHQRYSTNTFPEWRLAQPFRTLAHNGEINTLSGNVNWMRVHEIGMASELFGEAAADVKPVVPRGASDSAALDAVFELLVRAGRTAPMAKALLIPEAWSKRADLMSDGRRAMYAYCNSVMEPWDGPAAICATDGRRVVAGLDRNGLRPLRYARTDSILVVGSEAGMIPIADDDVIEKGAVPAGQLIAVDLDQRVFTGPEATIDGLADAHPYADWVQGIVELDSDLAGSGAARHLEDDQLRRLQAAAGYTRETLDMLLRPMAETAAEAVGSMGDDAPLAVLSDHARPLAHFFRQNFSQVTNPPIDPLREGRVMSLKTRFQNMKNVLAEDAGQVQVFTLESPVVSNARFERMCAHFGESVRVVDCTFDAAADGEPAQRLKAALDDVRVQAIAAVRGGAAHLVLSDQAQTANRAAVPMLLATAAIHNRLVEEGLRTYCSLNVRASDAVDTHSVACLIGCGATTVNPYLAEETILEHAGRGVYADVDALQASRSYRAALDKGIMKILSKLGISVISSYRGGMNFEALGLSRALVDEFFPGVPSRISGIGLAGIAHKALELHAQGFGLAPPRLLPIGGNLRQKARGEAHVFDAETISLLQQACDRGDMEAYRAFADRAEQRNRPIEIRDLLELNAVAEPVPLSEVESVNAVRKRFVTPGMSLGALSPEAHGTLNVAMNRIGAKSVSGEGGEDPDRAAPMSNGDNADSAVKQIASGRFGVTAAYLNRCREIEIKVAQGAKPGEGGQLPGFKVTELIAKFRHATPGVTLISPPPHHDIYSIEDLAQLIYDLKQINPVARVCVKLVSTLGIGPIAAGVAKAGADVILISGHSGGTGASPQSSIKHAGLPWEIGLAEANQTLRLNGLRHLVTLRVDGGIRTGRDVVIAALLGAEQFGIGTASLVALGCLMVRQCHSNTCPVGICTQDDELRSHYRGAPEKIVHLMTFIAEDVRQLLGRLGARSVEEIVGRGDLLAQVSRGADHLDDLDFNPLLMVANPDGPRTGPPEGVRREPTPSLDETILADARPVFERSEKMQLDYDVRNTDRTIGARVSSEIVRRFGEPGLPAGQLTIRLSGAAGQSLGAFAVQGLRLDLTGEANDYVGKGLSGGEIVLRPPARAPRDAATSVILGNTALYGATSGALFAAGRAGERFAVRNSGAIAVVEGCGDNGCEYMTGGEIVILGRTGDNFGAGMTGGMAFVYDPDDALPVRLNDETVVMRSIASAEWAVRLTELLEAHVQATGSERGEALLARWTESLAAFRQICPKEMLDRLESPATASAA